VSGQGESPAFVSGIELSRGFFDEAVRPVLQDLCEDLDYSAALIGTGSEVLGFDDRVSRDHHWGPRVMLFLTPEDLGEQKDRIRERLALSLPYEYRGYTTNFTPPDPNDNGTQQLRPITSGPINHRVTANSLPAFVEGYVGLDIRRPLDAIDWLTLPQQKLRTLVAGAVFHDGLAASTIWPEASSRHGVLTELRRRLAWYPDGVWRYLLAAGWARIGQEEHLMGRAGQRGDEIGSALIGARLVRDIMRLGFTMEKQYAPYPKWLGTAFGSLACGPRLVPHLAQALHARDWHAREQALVAAYEVVAAMHNELGLTASMPDTVRPFFSRPFRVIAMQGFARALLDSIEDGWLGDVLRRSPIGNIDLLSDNTDFLEEPLVCPAVAALYRTLSQQRD
jgi:hypothetical protein